MELSKTIWDEEVEKLVWKTIKDVIWNNLYNFASIITNILINVQWDSYILDQFCYYKKRLSSWMNLFLSEKFLLFIKENRVLIEDLLENR